MNDIIKKILIESTQMSVDFDSSSIVKDFERLPVKYSKKILNYLTDLPENSELTTQNKNIISSFIKGTSSRILTIKIDKESASIKNIGGNIEISSDNLSEFLSKLNEN